MKPRNSLLLSLVLLACGLSSSTAQAQWKVADRFPVISLPAAEDASFRSVADYRGRPLLLHIYASW
jgi:hypothetical protein